MFFLNTVKYRKKRRSLFSFWHQKYDSLFALSLSLFFIFVPTFSILYFEKNSTASASYALILEEEEKEKKPPQKENPFINIEKKIEAHSFIVYDATLSKMLYGHNEKEILPLASITKVMTALVASEETNEKDVISISQYALDTIGDSGFFLGEEWNAKDLIAFTLLTSSNDGAEALASTIGKKWHFENNISSPYAGTQSFVHRMNMRAKELDLKSFYFRNPTGLDWGKKGTEGGVGHAYDTARLFAYTALFYKDALRGTYKGDDVFYSESGFLHYGHNTNPYASHLYGILGSKTGYTELAGGNLGVVFDAGMGHTIVIVVLNSSREGRFSDVFLLHNAFYDFVESGWYEYEHGVLE
jgi:D-alanyl-D-alanine carboxypeptidase